MTTPIADGVNQGLQYSDAAAKRIEALIFGKNTLDEAFTWEGALCAETDPEAFFPEKGESSHEGKRICESCPLQQACLQYALENNEEFGIWGGLSSTERKRIRRERRLAEENQGSRAA